MFLSEKPLTHMGYRGSHALNEARAVGDQLFNASGGSTHIAPDRPA